MASSYVGTSRQPGGGNTARRPPSAYGHSAMGKENDSDAANLVGPSGEEEAEEEDVGPPPDR